MAKVLFYTATAEKFAALEQKNDQALYFITDAGELYKGAVRFGFPVKLVDEFPETGEAGLLYANADGDAKVWSGNAFIGIGSNRPDVFLSSAVRHTVTAEEAGKDVFADMVAGDVGVLFTLNDNTKLFVRLTDLVDTYTADNTAAKGVSVRLTGTRSRLKPEFPPKPEICLNSKTTEFTPLPSNGRPSNKERYEQTQGNQTAEGDCGTPSAGEP